jgi:transcription initiation factor TFIIA small subunit
MLIPEPHEQAMNEALETKVRTKISFKGHLHTYRFCDNVWTFIIEDASFKGLPDGPENMTVDKVKIVACDGKANQRKE